MHQRPEVEELQLHNWTKPIGYRHCALCQMKRGIDVGLLAWAASACFALLFVGRVCRQQGPLLDEGVAVPCLVVMVAPAVMAQTTGLHIR